MNNRNNISCFDVRVAIAIFAIVLFSSAISMADTKVWTGGGENANVSNPANWSGNSAPGNGDAWEFGAVGSSGYNITNDYGSGTYNSGITFTEAATGSYTISPNWTCQTGDIVNNSSYPQYVSLGHELHNSITINAANGDLVLSQYNTINLYGNNLTIDGSHTVSVAIIIAGNGSVLINPDATLAVSSQIYDSVQSITIKPGAALQFANHDTFGNHLSHSSVQLIADGGTITNQPGWFNTLNLVTLKNGGKIIDNSGHYIWTSFQLVGECNVTADSPLSADQISTIGIGTVGEYNGIVPFGVNFKVDDVTGNNSTDLLVSARLRDAGRAGDGGGYFTKSGAGTMELTAFNEITGNVTISEGTLKLSENGTFGYGSVTNNASLEFAYNSDQTTIGNLISGTGELIKTGAGTLTLTQAPAYTGATTIESGTLSLSTDATLYNLSGGSLDENGQIAVAAHLDASGKTLTLSNNKDSKFVGSITAGTIEKIDNKVLQIYADAQNKVSADSLLVSSGELDFKGYFEGNIEVINGAVFSPGNSVGEANLTGSISFTSAAAASNGVALFEFGEYTGEDVNHDTFVLGSDNLFIADDGVIRLLFESEDSAAQWATKDKEYKLVTNGGFSNDDYSPWLSNYTDWFKLTGKDDSLYLVGQRSAPEPGSGVPEPSTWALLALGVVVLFLRKRKN
ncbi:MAG: autotransporter-associated beta strand repeat-containing protein [Thermoguttaceae bacterium]|nr:autotransporter-associated beta strand repeat-containing protein [Thermoguttaceae bacterium]